jgi:hypothetical protein
MSEFEIDESGMVFFERTTCSMIINSSAIPDKEFFHLQ